MTLLALTGIFILGLGVFFGFKMGMLARILVTSSIYQKVCVAHDACCTLAVILF